MSIATNIMSAASINCHSIKVRDILLYFARIFISNYINIDNYYLLSLCKTKRHNIKWKIMN